MDTGSLLLLLIVGAGLAIFVALMMLGVILRGAVALLPLAGSLGLLGLAIYITLWIFLFPVMVVLSAIVGLGDIWLERRAEREEREVDEIRRQAE